MITWSTFIFTQGLMVDPIQVIKISKKKLLHTCIYLRWLMFIAEWTQRMSYKVSQHMTKTIAPGEKIMIYDIRVVVQICTIPTLYWPNFQFKEND